MSYKPNPKPKRRVIQLELISDSDKSCLSDKELLDDFIKQLQTVGSAESYLRFPLFKVSS